jgi:anti-sigma regulatory factor (Ser/Thr protein kinase)
MNAAAAKHFTVQEPARFLRWLAQSSGRLDLCDVALIEMWALTAMAAQGRRQLTAPLAFEWTPNSPAHRFAMAVGFEDVIEGKCNGLAGETGRTVRLSRVVDEDGIQPVAFEVARLLAGDEPRHEAARLTIEYVVVESLRNVVQHSGDFLGGVVGAQRNDRGRHATKPVFQVSIADAGVGIRATLSRTHPDVLDDDVALEQALWPYHSGAFAPGRAGGLENAGLGLFYISEMAKELGGRLLLSSGTASLLVDPSLPSRIERLDVGYAGTLVAFEVPTELPEDFETLFQRISQMAQERSPRRLTREWLKFETPPDRIQRFIVSTFVENNEAAMRLAREQMIPRLLKKEPVALDFVNVRIITQSFAHALLFEALRIAWATQTPLYAVNAQPVVQSALRHVEQYAQAG